jgi:hypothetical protein
MTALNKSTQIPAGITTLEEIIAWSLLTFYNLQKNTKYLEADDSALIPVITCQQGLAADKTERLIFRVSLELDPAFITGNLKLWDYVKELATTTIPADYTT